MSTVPSISVTSNSPPPQPPSTSRDSSVGIAIRVLGFDSRWGLGIFLFTAASRTALRHTQPPIQWIPGALSLGAKRPGREADHSTLSSAEVKEWMELYLHSPYTPSCRGAQLKHRDNFTFTFTPPQNNFSLWRGLAILNEQSTKVLNGTFFLWTWHNCDRGWSSSLGIGRGA
jgi:hypothetical protein